jgi:hypothetical protein
MIYAGIFVPLELIKVVGGPPVLLGTFGLIGKPTV